MTNSLTQAHPRAPRHTFPVLETLVVALEAVKDCVIITDARCIVRFVNRSAEKLTGWSAAEALGRHLDDILKLVEQTSGATGAAATTMLGRWRIKGAPTARFLLVDRRGRRIPVEFQNQSSSFGRSLSEKVLLFRDISERIRAEQEGARLLAAEESNRSKDRYLSMMAHEIRNPLTAISSAAQELTTHGELPAGMQSDAEIVRENVDRIARLLRDVLDNGRHAAGFRIVPATVDLHAIVRRTLRSLRRDIETKEISWELRLEADRHVVRADADRLQQVLWNLITNAVKFTPAGGEIGIRSRNRSDGRIDVTVTDTGIGIEPEQLPQIFDLYYQGRNETSGGPVGWGIGLAVSKAIVEAHNGRLGASSLGRNRGSTFVLELDVVDPDADGNDDPTIHLFNFNTGKQNEGS